MDNHENKNINTQPSAELEDRIVDSLKQRGAFKLPFVWNLSLSKAVVTLLLGAAIFFSGWLAGKNSLNGSREDDQYLLLLYNTEKFENDPSRSAEYGRWFKTLNDPKAIGEELTDTAWSIAGSERRVSVGVSESRINGFFVYSAASKEKALSIASSIPHLNYDGSIEVRKVKK
jgi:hypothetical protein